MPMPWIHNFSRRPRLRGCAAGGAQSTGRCAVITWRAESAEGWQFFIIHTSYYMPKEPSYKMLQDVTSSFKLLHLSIVSIDAVDISTRPSSLSICQVV